MVAGSETSLKDKLFEENSDSIFIHFDSEWLLFLTNKALAGLLTLTRLKFCKKIVFLKSFCFNISSFFFKRHNRFRGQDITMEIILSSVMFLGNFFTGVLSNRLPLDLVRRLAFLKIVLTNASFDSE